MKKIFKIILSIIIMIIIVYLLVAFYCATFYISDFSYGAKMAALFLTMVFSVFIIDTIDQ